MKSYHTITDSAGRKLHSIIWEPDEKEPVAVVQIIHGLAEHAERYSHFAGYLNRQGFLVVAHDHRGHGKTDPDLHGYIDAPDGFSLMAENIGDVRKEIAKRWPDLPLFMFGHSMGSFLLQRYLQLNDQKPDGIIYSGSNGKPPSNLKAGIMLSSIITKLKGREHPSALLYNLTFGGYNKNFKPARTEADWLSRDPAMVDLYIDDPSSGFVSSTSFFHDLFRGVKQLHSHHPFIGNHADVPILIISGDSDPVSRMGKGIQSLESIIRNSGSTDLTVKTYADGRHEMLNEVNREEVYRDITEWINSRLESITKE
ncbi:MAG: lysophospholipase [Balneolaceae bacterium]|nr:lysophospholipase [Balneolaceae bacterium]MCH8550261.1 alpha/beta hydrolase [Balneolaceae bacterium]